ncbi:MAG: hypothetical protein LBU88_03075, partial [Treponema sp.]|nr:hypothetical protein [Treponema sp.]
MRKSLDNMKHRLAQIIQISADFIIKILNPWKSVLICGLFLIIAACNNPFDLFEQEKFEYTPPSGMGAFSLQLSENVSRTILPSTPAVTYFTSYSLVFTAVSGGVDQTVTRTNIDVTQPVNLVPGTYSLIVTALRNDQPAARGTLTNIIITLGGNTSETVVLKTLLAEGTGTFSWVINFPDEVTSATLTIRNPAGEQQGVVETLVSNIYGNRELP